MGCCGWEEEVDPKANIDPEDYSGHGLIIEEYNHRSPTIDFVYTVTDDVGGITYDPVKEGNLTIQEIMVSAGVKGYKVQMSGKKHEWKDEEYTDLMFILDMIRCGKYKYHGTKRDLACIQMFLEPYCYFWHEVVVVRCRNDSASIRAFQKIRTSLFSHVTMIDNFDGEHYLVMTETTFNKVATLMGGKKYLLKADYRWRLANKTT